MPAVSYACYYGAVFLALGVLVPFWPVWLESRGLTPEQIGLILALPAWLKVVTTPAIARLADRTGRARSVLAGAVALAFAGFAAFLGTAGFWPILLVTLISSIPLMSLIPLGDSLALRQVYRDGLDYGRIRLWGSLTFLLASTGAGYLLARAGSDPLLWAILAALAATFFCTLVLPAPVPASAAERGSSLRQLLRSRPFLWFLAAGSLLQASHAAFYGFSAVYWRSSGIDAGTIGLLWALGVVAEILLFAGSRRLTTRWRPAVWLLLAAGGGLLRWVLLAETTALPLLIVGQCLHALTFGAAHLGAMHFIAQNAPRGLEAQAQSLYSAVAGGIAMGLAMLAAGELYGLFGGRVFHAMALLSLIGGLAALALLRSGRSRRIEPVRRDVPDLP